MFYRGNLVVYASRRNIGLVTVLFLSLQAKPTTIGHVRSDRVSEVPFLLRWLYILLHLLMRIYLLYIFLHVHAPADTERLK